MKINKIKTIITEFKHKFGAYEVLQKRLLLSIDLLSHNNIYATLDFITFNKRVIISNIFNRITKQRYKDISIPEGLTDKEFISYVLSRTERINKQLNLINE